MSNHSQVVQFNLQVLGIQDRKLGLMSPNEFSLSLKQLREEVKEMEEAYDRGDLVGVVDGMVDLNFFLLGVVYKHGISEKLYEKLFSAVSQANMEKKKGVKSGREGFGDAADAIKPEDWVPPEERIATLLDEEFKGQQNGY